MLFKKISNTSYRLFQCAGFVDLIVTTNNEIASQSNSSQFTNLSDLWSEDDILNHASNAPCLAIVPLRDNLLEHDINFKISKSINLLGY